MMEKWQEGAEFYFTTEADLRDAVTEMEQNSSWITDIPSNQLVLVGVPSPIEAEAFAKAHGLDVEITRENSSGAKNGRRDMTDSGTGLVLSIPDLTNPEATSEWLNVSRSAWGTLTETAKLSGSALNVMDSKQAAQCLNMGLAVAKGKSRILKRYGKIMAVHTMGYIPMPISNLLSVVKKELESRFGFASFIEGRNSATYTTALYTLPSQQKALNAKYESALAGSVSRVHGTDNIMPAVRFSSSDTARSAATLEAIFLRNDEVISLTDPVGVKHEQKAKGLSGIDAFEKLPDELFARFDESFKLIEKLAKQEIKNPVNAYVGVVNYLNRGNSAIPQHYAESGRMDVEFYAVNNPVMSAYDIYLCLGSSVAMAESVGAPHSTIVRMQEAIAKSLKLDWTKYDIGGTVAWGRGK